MSADHSSAGSDAVHHENDCGRGQSVGSGDGVCLPSAASCQLCVRQQGQIAALEVQVRELGEQLRVYGNASLGIASRIALLERRGTVMEDDERAEAIEAVESLEARIECMQQYLEAAGLERYCWLDDDGGWTGGGR